MPKINQHRQPSLGYGPDIVKQSKLYQHLSDAGPNSKYNNTPIRQSIQELDPGKTYSKTRQLFSIASSLEEDTQPESVQDLGKRLRHHTEIEHCKKSRNFERRLDFVLVTENPIDKEDNLAQFAEALKAAALPEPRLTEIADAVMAKFTEASTKIATGIHDENCQNNAGIKQNAAKLKTVQHTIDQLNHLALGSSKTLDTITLQSQAQIDTAKAMLAVRDALNEAQSLGMGQNSIKSKLNRLCDSIQEIEIATNDQDTDDEIDTRSDRESPPVTPHQFISPSPPVSIHVIDGLSQDVATDDDATPLSLQDHCRKFTGIFKQPAPIDYGNTPLRKLLSSPPRSRNAKQGYLTQLNEAAQTLITAGEQEQNIEKQNLGIRLSKLHTLLSPEAKIEDKVNILCSDALPQDAKTFAKIMRSAFGSSKAGKANRASFDTALYQQLHQNWEAGHFKNNPLKQQQTLDVLSALHLKNPQNWKGLKRGIQGEKVSYVRSTAQFKKERFEGLSLPSSKPAPKEKDAHNPSAPRRPKPVRAETPENKAENRARKPARPAPPIPVAVNKDMQAKQKQNKKPGIKALDLSKRNQTGKRLFDSGYSGPSTTREKIGPKQISYLVRYQPSNFGENDQDLQSWKDTQKAANKLAKGPVKGLFARIREVNGAGQFEVGGTKHFKGVEVFQEDKTDFGPKYRRPTDLFNAISQGKRLDVSSDKPKLLNRQSQTLSTSKDSYKTTIDNTTQVLSDIKVARRLLDHHNSQTGNTKLIVQDIGIEKGRDGKCHAKLYLGPENCGSKVDLDRVERRLANNLHNYSRIYTGTRELTSFRVELDLPSDEVLGIGSDA